MRAYAMLLRGINVGGRNRMPMAVLRRCLEDLGFSGVSIYIASGNIALQSDWSAEQMRDAIEATLPRCFVPDGSSSRCWC